MLSLHASSKVSRCLCNLVLPPLCTASQFQQVPLKAASMPHYLWLLVEVSAFAVQIFSSVHTPCWMEGIV